MIIILVLDAELNDGLIGFTTRVVCQASRFRTVKRLNSWKQTKISSWYFTVVIKSKIFPVGANFFK